MKRMNDEPGLASNTYRNGEKVGCKERKKKRDVRPGKISWINV